MKNSTYIYIHTYIYIYIYKGIMHIKTRIYLRLSNLELN